MRAAAAAATATAVVASLAPPLNPYRWATGPRGTPRHTAAAARTPGSTCTEWACPQGARGRAVFCAGGLCTDGAAGWPLLSH
jgi:hypothetical protein